jgi:hypothetical protein
MHEQVWEGHCCWACNALRVEHCMTRVVALLESLVDFPPGLVGCSCGEAHTCRLPTSHATPPHCLLFRCSSASCRSREAVCKTGKLADRPRTGVESTSSPLATESSEVLQPCSKVHEGQLPPPTQPTRRPLHGMWRRAHMVCGGERTWQQEEDMTHPVSPRECNRERHLHQESRSL